MRLTRRQSRLLADLTLPAAMCLGCVLIVVLFRPGFMSHDSVEQLRQARAGVYDDIPPPLMSVVWRQLDAIVPGPFGMLVLHNLLFWCGLGLVVRWFRLRPWMALGALLVGLSPPIAGLLSTIWKDVGAGASLLVAFSLIGPSTTTRRRLVVAMIPLLYAMGVRHNMFIAALPLVVLWAIRVRTVLLPSSRRSIVVVIAAAAFAILLALVWSMNAALTDIPRLPVQQIWLHDLVALSIATQHDYLRSLLSPAQVGQLVLHFRHESVVATLAGTSFSTDRRWVSALFREWRSAVLDRPRAYLAHRWRMMRSLLGIGRQTLYAFHDQIAPNPFGITLARSPARDVALGYFESFRNSFLFRGWFYVLWHVVLLVVGLRRRVDRAPLVVLAASALAYIAAYYFIATGDELRLIWWAAVAAAASLVVIAGSPRQARTAS
jgi:hypothetical protein